MAFKSNTKNGDRASLRKHSWILYFVSYGVDFFSKAAQNCVFWLWNDFIWQNLLKAVCFGQNAFF